MCLYCDLIFFRIYQFSNFHRTMRHVLTAGRNAMEDGALVSDMYGVIAVL